MRRAARRGQRSGSVVRVRFLPSGRELEVEPGTKICRAAAAAGLAVGTLCEGRLDCGVCRIDVVEGGAALADPRRAEARTLRVLHAAPHERLACKTRLAGTGTVVIRASYW